MVNLQVERLKRLPQRADDTWQGGLVRMPAWVTGEGPKPFRPVSAVWLSLQTGLLHMSPETRRPEDADFAMALDAVAGFAANEALAGYRPGKLEVKNPALAEHLSGLLAEAGIRVECCGRLLALERVLQDLAEHVHEGPMPPGPLEGKGVTVERMRSFAEAAKVFFEAAPWQHLSNEDLLEIESPPPAGMKYAVVLGAGGAGVRPGAVSVGGSALCDGAGGGSGRPSARRALVVHVRRDDGSSTGGRRPVGRPRPAGGRRRGVSDGHAV